MFELKTSTAIFYTKPLRYTLSPSAGQSNSDHPK